MHKSRFISLPSIPLKQYCWRQDWRRATSAKVYEHVPIFLRESIKQKCFFNLKMEEKCTEKLNLRKFHSHEDPAHEEWDEDGCEPNTKH